MTDVVDVLCSRREYVEAIDGGCREKSEVADELGVSESMVYKAVRELRQQDVVEDSAYDLTVTGRLLLDEYRRMQKIASASEVFDSLDVPADVLDDARPVLPRRHAPQKPIEKLEDAAERADEVKGLAPTVIERYVTSIERLIRENGLDAEFVVEETALTELSTNYSEKFGGSMDMGMEVLSTEQELPFGLALLDDAAAVIVAYDDRGRVQGSVFLRSPDAVEWAEHLYQGCREDAVLVNQLEL